MGKIENDEQRKIKNAHFIRAFEYVAQRKEMNQTQLATAIGSKTAYIQQYQVFTFPYLSAEGTLKMTLNALDASGNVLTTRTLTDVPVTRNRITRCTGVLFGDGDFDIKQTTFGISVNDDWDGEIEYHF